MNEQKHFPSDVDLVRMFIEENLDVKTIAESYGVHPSTVRRHIRRLGLRKDHKAAARSMSARHMRLHGYWYPAQRPDVMDKLRRPAVSIIYTDRIGRKHSLRSLAELGYALLLDASGSEWYYREMVIQYVDMLSGRQRVHVIDFTVVGGDKIEWIEARPQALMVPEDKRIYAARRAEETGVIYRGLTKEELHRSEEMLSNRLSGVSFVNNPPRRNSTRITYYFKSRSDAIKYELRGWIGSAQPTRIGSHLWARTYHKSE